MDTRYWGGSAWQLFHLIAEGSPSPGRTLSMIQHVLPCKFCRESTTNFVSDLPLPTSGDTGRWMYEIHRKVNHKLATQAKTDHTVILPDPDPTYEEVHAKYTALLKSKPRAVPGRDFLFAIAYNYPDKPDYDQTNAQQTFLRSLRATYPFPELRAVYAKYIDSHPMVLASRTGYLHWMYGLLRRLARKTNSSIRTFKGYTHHVAYYKSGCAKSTYHGKTCRRLDNGGYTKSRDHKRTRRIAVGGLLT